MTAADITVPQSGAEKLAEKIPALSRIQAVAYSIVVGQWAVGFWSGVYVLVTQAHYFGKSFKNTWDNLPQLMHLGAIPGIGHFIIDNADLARHIFFRDAPEAILGYAFVAMIITILATKEKEKTPWLDRQFVKLHIPSVYQGRFTIRHGPRKGQRRRADTSPAQFVLLLPSMLLTAVPGEAIMAAAIFGGIALAHHRGYHSPWLEPTSPWVSPLIGIAGGRFAGHRPAIKAGYDIQRYFIGKRLWITYTADRILLGFKAEEITQDAARNKLTRMRRADPSLLYPISYRRLYDKLLAQRAKVREYSSWSRWVFGLGMAIALIIGLWGVYLRKWGIGHGFWLPW
jgi:hypothetical protein